MSKYLDLNAEIDLKIHTKRIVLKKINFDR